MITRLHRLASDELWLGLIAYEQTGSLLGMASVLATDLAARTGQWFTKARRWRANAAGDSGRERGLRRQRAEGPLIPGSFSRGRVGTHALPTYLPTAQPFTFRIGH